MEEVSKFRDLCFEKTYLESEKEWPPLLLLPFSHLQRAISLWVLDPPERDAVLANLALQNSVPDYKVLVEIACVRSPEDLLAARRAYRCRYKRSLEEDLASRTTGDIRRLLVAIASAYKYDGEEMDEDLAHSEAVILHDEILGRAVNHEETIRVLSTRSSTQLSAIFNRYKDTYGRSVVFLTMSFLTSFMKHLMHRISSPTPQMSTEDQGNMLITGPCMVSSSTSAC